MFLFEPTTADANDDTPSLTIGGTNASLFTGAINYIPLVDAGSYWLIPLTDIKVGGVSSGVNFPATIIDTGTSLIGMPLAAVRAIYSRVPNAAPFGSQGLWSFPCRSVFPIAPLLRPTDLTRLAVQAFRSRSRSEGSNTRCDPPISTTERLRALVELALEPSSLSNRTVATRLLSVTPS